VNIRPISKCQSNFNEVAELCRTEREAVFITRNGYEDLVLMRADDYERDLARLAIYDKLAAAQRQIDAGEALLGHDELFAELRERLAGNG
jgi:PHD/YefM family antitoxin component YafN of YafNO toxin-antitoxin module